MIICPFNPIICVKWAYIASYPQQTCKLNQNHTTTVCDIEKQHRKPNKSKPLIYLLVFHSFYLEFPDLTGLIFSQRKVEVKQKLKVA